MAPPLVCAPAWSPLVCIHAWPPPLVCVPSAIPWFWWGLGFGMYCM